MQVTRMGDALRATGRPIFYSTEMGGANFGPDICNSAREGSDISPSWERILYELDVGSKFADMAGPGFHNDFDMLGERAFIHSFTDRLIHDKHVIHYAVTYT